MRASFLSLVALAAIAGSGCSAESSNDDAADNASTEVSTVPATDYLTIPFETITGDSTNLQAFEGKTVLVVNVASECGFTPQYAGLEELYREFKDSGLVILGFPANNFGGQEPGSNEEILKFCLSRFDVTFPMMAKVSVLGTDKHPLFTYLTEESDLPGEIQWNFSKFLINPQGELVARFPSQTKPSDEELVSKIRASL